MSVMMLRTHDLVIRGKNLTLRPLTEDDWGILFSWNNDPEVLYFAEGDDVAGYDLAQVQSIYRAVSQNAYCFIASTGGVPIGECWLQEMNLDRILRLYPNRDCRRIDLMIGERDRRGRGLGTEMIRVLTNFAFNDANADLVFGCDIADYNIASLKAFQNAGYKVIAKIKQPPSRKARYCWDLVIEADRE
jgi:RimJ/RimL family protein N-acetyltransferase